MSERARGQSSERKSSPLDIPARARGRCPLNNNIQQECRLRRGRGSASTVGCGAQASQRTVAHSLPGQRGMGARQGAQRASARRASTGTDAECSTEVPLKPTPQPIPRTAHAAASRPRALHQSAHVHGRNRDPREQSGARGKERVHRSSGEHAMPSCRPGTHIRVDGRQPRL